MYFQRKVKHVPIDFFIMRFEGNMFLSIDEPLYVFTIATDRRGYLLTLEESCAKKNITLHVHGLGQKWDGTKFFLMKVSAAYV